MMAPVEQLTNVNQTISTIDTISSEDIDSTSTFLISTSTMKMKIVK